MNYTEKDLTEIALSFMNMEVVGVICQDCHETNNVLQSDVGFLCGCNFYNRLGTGRNLPFKNPKYGATTKTLSKVYENLENSYRFAR